MTPLVDLLPNALVGQQVSVDWYRRYWSPKRSDIAQSCAGLGQVSLVIFLSLSTYKKRDARRTEFVPMSVDCASRTRLADLIHPTTVEERRPILMRLKKMCLMLAFCFMRNKCVR
jgi:hypothetical protein